MEESKSPSDIAPISRLKIAGAWSGVLDVELQAWTVPMLRRAIADRSNCSPDCINLFCGGKILKDGDGNQKLNELGLKNNSKILANRVSPDHGKALRDELMEEAERSRRLERIRAAAVALAKRHADGSLPVEDFNIELEDQSGRRVHLGSENDQRAVIMGLMLHANAKHLIKEQKYKDALDVLAMGEEAFSLCDLKVIEMIDNVPMLQIDMVWCYFMLRDISWLSMAGVRLAKAREGFEQSHGKNATRVRLLQAGCHPELAIYLRLELLEGVVAFHSGLYEQSQKALTSAKAKYLQLQVSDEALSLLMSMGYMELSAKRALRMTNQDVEAAVNFLVEEKARKAQRRFENTQRQAEILEQKKYGKTPLKKPVDLQRLNELASIGFEKLLAAEALRRNENDTEKALDDLTNPVTNATLQLYIEAKKKKKSPKEVSDADIDELMSMGFERSIVVSALHASDTKEQALMLLVADQLAEPTVQANEDSALLSENNADPVGDPSGSGDLEERDAVMEDEIANTLTGDPLSDYDIEVAKEGEAIEEYLALLASTAEVKDCVKAAT